MIYIYIFIILILFILFMDLGIYININGNNITIKIILFNVIKINIKRKTKNKNKKIKNKKKSQKENFSLSSLLNNIKLIINPLEKLIANIKLNISLNMVYGFSEPDKTAIVYGVINSVIYLATNFIDNKIKSFKKKIDITPDLKHRVFKIDGYIYIKIKIIYLINFVVKILTLYLKNKKQEVK